MKKIDKEKLKAHKEKLKEHKEKLKNNKVGKGASEFRDFIMRGDVVDLAVGVIIGGIDFSHLSVDVLDAKIMYGSFIQQVIDFLIVALCIFLFIKVINALTRKDKREEEKKAKAAAEANKKSEEVLLLEEIRDLLKEKNK